MSTVYRTFITDDKKQIWKIPAKLMFNLNLQENETVTLYCGSKSAHARVSSFQPKHSDNLIGLSSDLKSTLSIPWNSVFHIKPEGNRSFRLGPVIGILTFSSHIPCRLDYYRAYFNMHANTSMLFVFSGKGLNAKQRTVTGYSYDILKKTWQKGEFPFPDAVIDRCYPNNYRSHIILKKVIGPNRVFNKKTMITKIDFAKTLAANTYLNAFIPETKVYRSNSDLDHFFAKYEHIYLKPSNAMKGTGIISIQKTDRGIFQCRYRLNKKDVIKSIDSLTQISDILRTAAGCKRRYIIQQAIDCLQYKGGPFSFRVSPMKNGNGQWVMAGLLALGSLNAAHITNFSSGGTIIPLTKLFDAIISQLPYTKGEFLDLLENLALKTAKALDEKFGPLGELGVDIVVGKKGKPWLLEANGNPAKIAAFVQIDYPAWRTHVYKYPLEYAAYLANFQGHLSSRNC